MFNREQIEAYRSIKAPDALRDRVLSSRKPRRLRLMPLAAVLAACLILALSLGTLSGDSSVLINGQVPDGSPIACSLSPAAENRAAPIYSFEVELTDDGTAEVSVSSGWVSAEGIPAAKSLTLRTPAVLCWETECDDATPDCTMEIRDADGTTAVTLTYKNAEITANKRRINQ